MSLLPGRISNGTYRGEDGRLHAFRGDPAFMEWLRQNDLDPRAVTEVHVDDEAIHVVELERDAAGNIVFAPDGVGPAKGERTVPVKVPLPHCMRQVHP